MLSNWTGWWENCIDGEGSIDGDVDSGLVGSKADPPELQDAVSSENAGQEVPPARVGGDRKAEPWHADHDARERLPGRVCHGAAD